MVSAIEGLTLLLTSAILTVVFLSSLVFAPYLDNTYAGVGLGIQFVNVGAIAGTLKYTSDRRSYEYAEHFYIDVLIAIFMFIVNSFVVTCALNVGVEHIPMAVMFAICQLIFGAITVHVGYSFWRYYKLNNAHQVDVV